ncbi:DeoR/GlpR family DNA-binding transcription regulator [Amycolatopsis jiangsuensis]|uniref:DeoR/GlpR family transcriptional regulator of sugar metabolism n=1 Tax=Amycolatopsis jiangsuensis TaxID=1181879 RepID=A0A840IVG1_9PSEU|nr:DeoR/GlpR family DNA-binding transcription regulator [Amycolatopsis jiangsuensis]MBB4685753.1 DeoR/GlpR family transcriptional regulator of sugar metabolism [Amycolatopsis jiangsuensis]
MTDAPPLIPEQRRDLILGHLRRDSVLSYRQLAALVGVSHMTVRRDVAELERQGRVVATQGGAKIVARLAAEPPRTEKAGADVAQKDAMARYAATLVRESMTIYLDAGTTLQALRPHLDGFGDLTVVTNDLVIAASYVDHPSIEIITLGGRVEKRNQSTVGRLPALALRELSLDIAFLSTSSWDLRRGVTIPAESKVDPKQAAVAAAETSVLVAASSKYGSFARYRILGLAELDLVITDGGLLDAQLAEIEAESGVEVHRAG